MDTQNDGLEKVTPLKHGHSWYPCISMLVFGSVITLFQNRPGSCRPPPAPLRLQRQDVQRFQRRWRVWMR